MQAPVTCDQLPEQTLTVEQAQVRILAAVKPMQAQERLNLHRAAGRILARDVLAGFDVPPHRNSSMDGYAFAHCSLQTGQSLQRVGSSFAGKPFAGSVALGECIRIMTGAVLPEGTDTVVMQENVSLDGETVKLHLAPACGENVRYPGEDIRQGDQVLQAGRKLNAADLGLLASLGVGEVDVLRRPRVAFLSTGDELKPMGSPLQAGDIHDSNRYILHALLQALDVETLDLGIIPDQAAAVEEAFRAAREVADVLITTGGASVGDADYIASTLAKLGQVDFWKMAMKPGKPFAHGHLGACQFFGLPGNPVSVMATFLLFVRPAILKGRGETTTLPPEYPATTTTPLQKAAGRKEYQRGVCSQTADGQWQVRSTGKQESHLLRSMSQANCFIVLERDSGNLPAGSTVRIMPFAGLL